jgi:hypothetical protein
VTADHGFATCCRVHCCHDQAEILDLPARPSVGTPRISEHLTPVNEGLEVTLDIFHVSEDDNGDASGYEIVLDRDQT